MSIFGAIAGPVLGAAVSGALGYGGAKESAKMSRASAREQMDFQERMSNTAHQRAATDLEAAGLNRILALGSPATTPAGAMAQVPNFGQAISQGIGAGAAMGSSAVQAAKIPAEIKELNAKADNLLQQSKVLTHEEKIKLHQSEVWSELGPIVAKAGKDFSNLLAIGTEVLGDMSTWLRDIDYEIRMIIEKFLQDHFGFTPEIDFSN